jgi:hypothetical protein
MRKTAHFPWFQGQFAVANGLEWLYTIGLGDHKSQDVILELLVDQIVFESASSDLNGPLECSYICLQTLRRSNEGQNEEQHHGIIVEHDFSTTLLDLREALAWVLRNAYKMRSERGLLASEDEFKVPTFAKIGRRKNEIQRHPGRIRSFKFAREMSNEEWDEWSSRVKTMVMGVDLRGLGCGPVSTQHRFTRDPEGICG